MNEFIEKGKSDWIKSPLGIVLLLFFAFTVSYLIALKGLLVAIGLLALPIVLLFFKTMFTNPTVGLWTVFVVEFFVLGLGRYITGIPLGLSVDGLLVLTYLALIFKNFNDGVKWKYAANILTYMALIWFAYALLELLNPETLSRSAWFYAMRGMSMYMILTVPLVMILWRKNKDIERFIILWAVFSILGSLKGWMQKTFGVDPFEQRWLNEGGALTHILFGKLRVFSFYSDAGQFGAAQAHAGVVFTILALMYKKNGDLKKAILFIITALAGFYGMLISGTRGAISVPIAGFLMYLILTKNIKILTLGGIMGFAIFFILRFTTIGSGNYDIQRMRSAFDPNDASLQTRLNNQAILKTYLASRPFGGGIGSSGAWGKRFSPHGFLANVATDSWYVVVWAEQGVVGLILHLIILFTVIFRSSYLIFYKIKNDLLKGQMMAFTSGLLGIMLASYGNAVLGQMPTGIILYICMAFMMTVERYDYQMDKESTKELS